MAVRQTEGTRTQVYMDGKPIDIVELKTVTVERTYGMFGQHTQQMQFTIPRGFEDYDTEYDNGKLKLKKNFGGGNTSEIEIDRD